MWSEAYVFISRSTRRIQTLQQKMRTRQSSKTTITTVVITRTWDFLGIQIRNLLHRYFTSRIIRLYAVTSQTSTTAPMVWALAVVITNCKFHHAIWGQEVYVITAVLVMWLPALLRVLLRGTAASNHSDLLFTCMQPLVSTNGAYIFIQDYSERLHKN
jgi:hypothetical protein